MPQIEYPRPEIQVLNADADWLRAYPRPAKISYDYWPPVQVQYLDVYLKQYGCQTVVIEKHYVDHAFMQDEAIYYVRSLRSYPNYTERLHFFTRKFDEEWWREIVDKAGCEQHTEIQKILQDCYLGFSVIRPLPDSPVGRTVLPPPENNEFSFETIRTHKVHLAGFTLEVNGVPFQSQDQGVSACATTALWSALDCVATKESITISSPASITESATRYPHQEGRPFPNEGLTVRQLCEATLSAGFSPIVIRSDVLEQDKHEIFSYTQSGFAPVLALIPANGNGPGHAVCCVGFQSGQPKAQIDPDFKYREISSGLNGLFIHDDRLGPYAFARLSQLTDINSGKIRTSVSIEWPDKKPFDNWYLHSILVPVPKKLRLTISRLKTVGALVAQFIGETMNQPLTTINCQFVASHAYIKQIYNFGLSKEGLYQAVCGTVMSRYVGIIEIANPTGPVLDIVVDSTEKNPSSAILACIMRSEFPKNGSRVFDAIAKWLGVVGIQ